MPGLLFGRIKVWLFQEDLASSDLNNEFNNILNNTNLGTIPGDSPTVNQMQVMVNPGGVGSESLATNAQGEIERLRFVIQRILGADSPQWYSAPAIDLTTVFNLLPGASSLQNGVQSGLLDANGQPMWLIPGVATNSVILQASPSNPFVVFINGVEFSFTSNITLAGLSLAPGSNNTALVDHNVDGSNIVSGAISKNFGEEDSQDILYDLLGIHAPAQIQVIAPFLKLRTVGSALTTIDNSLVALEFTHSAVNEFSVGFLRGSATRFENVLRGCMFNSSSVAVPRVAIADGDTVTLLKLSFIFLLSNGTLDVTYNKPSYGAQVPVSPATGDYWYDMSANQWKKFNGTSFVANNSVFVGISAQNSTVTVGARSCDPIASYSNTSQIWLRRNLSSRDLATSDQGGIVSVYGKNLNFSGGTLEYSIARDQSGAFAANDFLFLYISAAGKQFIDNVAPHRRPELGGYYHPSRPLRCLAASYSSDGSGFGDASNLNCQIRNLKAPSAMRERLTRVVLPGAGGTTTTSSVVLETLQLMMRGGKLKVSASANQGVPQFLTVSNGSALQTQAAIFFFVIDEFGNGQQFFLNTVITPSGSGAATAVPADGKVLTLNPMSGEITISLQLGITNVPGGTPSVNVGTVDITFEEIF